MRLPHSWHTLLNHATSFIHLLRLSFMTITVIVAFSSPQNLFAAGPYSSSAHGNSVYGVDRDPNYPSKGHCAHCHELKSGNPSALFYDSNVTQTDNVCFECHTAGSPNYGSYSYRAGGSGSTSSIISAFAPTAPGTAHNLDDILTFIKTKSWGYSGSSNPCVACHNPHAAQGDPANSSGTKSSPKGSPVSLPSLHTDASGSWGLWGDTASETMATLSTYQAPYRYDLSTADGFDNGFEPRGEGSAGAAALSTTDFVTFCTNCHNAFNTIYSTTLGRNLKTINWDIEKHGKGVATPSGKADGKTDLMPPYSDASLGTYVLSCLDCHEPHGSANAYLLRPEVNGTAGVNVTTLTGDANGPAGPGQAPCNKEWTYLCAKCHTRLGDGDDGFHVHDNSAGCVGCHPIAPACFFIPCGTCHFHGAVNLF